MKVLLCGDMDPAELEGWRAALELSMPEATWLSTSQALDEPLAVQAAVVANPVPGSLQGLPNLRLIQSLWAGVDRLLTDTTLPPDVPIARMVDPSMTAAMTQTALWAVLSLHRGFFVYARRQRSERWQVHAQRCADEVSVLVLGQGEMGRAVTAGLVQQGYQVTGWRHDGQLLRPLLATAEIVVNLLPLTTKTRGLLDASFFAALPRGASLVNLARGAHVVDTDLLAALGAVSDNDIDNDNDSDKDSDSDSDGERGGDNGVEHGHLRHAVLDVFHTEPLPAGHAFWRHPRITVLPHAAAFTDPRSAAAVVATNLRALSTGGSIANLVDRQRGY